MEDSKASSGLAQRLGCCSRGSGSVQTENFQLIPRVRSGEAQTFPESPRMLHKLLAEGRDVIVILIIYMAVHGAFTT